MAFLWGAAGEKLTPKQASEQRKIAQALLAQASDTSPVGHWTAALNRGLQGWLGGRQSYLAREGEKLGDEHASSIYKSLPGMGGGSVASALAGGGAPVAGGGVNPVNIGGSQEEFINALMPYALQVQEQYGIAPEITLAQAALETGWGKSAPGNNFFGIKSHGKAGGNTLATTEVINGQPVRVNDSFRAYGSPGESVLDYGRFLSENPRYKPMLAASGDLEAQIDALGKSGYATDPNYASKIRSIAYGIGGRQGSVADAASVGAAPAAGGGSAALLAAMADPHVAERYGPQIQAMLGQAQARENAVFEQQLAAQDPLRQLQIEKGQIELEQMRNPGKKPPIEVGGVLLDADTFLPVFDSRQPDGTSDTKNYDRYVEGAIARGETPMPFENYQALIARAGSGAATGVGTIPAGYQALTDPLTGAVTGLQPIPGGPAELEADKNAAALEAREANKANAAAVVMQNIDKAIENTSGLTAGLGGSILGNLPGSGATDLKSTIDTIVANIGFDRLQQMRDSSPTGGALGGIAVQELNMLQAVLGSLSQSQSPAQLKENLVRLKSIYGPIAAKAAAYPNAGQFGFGGEAKAAEDDASILMAPELNGGDIEVIRPDDTVIRILTPFAEANGETVEEMWGRMTPEERREFLK